MLFLSPLSSISRSGRFELNETAHPQGNIWTVCSLGLLQRKPLGTSPDRVAREKHFLSLEGGSMQEWGCWVLWLVDASLDVKLTNHFSKHLCRFTFPPAAHETPYSSAVNIFYYNYSDGRAVVSC